MNRLESYVDFAHTPSSTHLASAELYPRANTSCADAPKATTATGGTTLPNFSSTNHESAMTTKHDKLNKTQRKAGLTPDEIDAFFDSDAYITINAKIYMANNMMLVSEQLFSDVSKHLHAYGIKMSDNLRTYISMTKQFYNRFLDEFGALYLPHEKENMDSSLRADVRNQNRIASENWQELDKWVEQELANVVSDGKRHRDWRKMRRNVGGGCNNCSKAESCQSCQGLNDIDLASKTCMEYTPAPEDSSTK